MMSSYQFELPIDLETDEYEDILTELIGCAYEITITAAGEMLYRHVANFDYIIDAIWVYGSDADRKSIQVDSDVKFVYAHGGYETLKFDPENMVVPKGSKLVVTSLAAGSGVHGVFIYGKKIYGNELEMYRK